MVQRGYFVGWTGGPRSRQYGEELLNEFFAVFSTGFPPGVLPQNRCADEHARPDGMAGTRTKVDPRKTIAVLYPRRDG